VGAVDERVVALWERAAATYETEVAYFTPMGERVVAHAALAPGEDVLDVACGKGATLLPAAVAVGPGGHVTGIDIVAAMVEAARAAAAARGLRNVAVEVMDAEALDFEQSRFDVVISAFGLGFLRPEHALPEIHRVLRDGGRLVASAPLGGGANWNFFGALCERYGLVSTAHPGGAQMPPLEEVARLFASMGFRVGAPVQDVVSVSFPDEETWWRWAWSHGQRAFLERLDASDVDAFKRDAFSALRSFATSDGILLEQQFLVLTAHT
jgi:SAM-dependent methyltransferase